SISDCSKVPDPDANTTSRAGFGSSSLITDSAGDSDSLCTYAPRSHRDDDTSNPRVFPAERLRRDRQLWARSPPARPPRAAVRRISAAPTPDRWQSFGGLLVFGFRLLVLGFH